jgi:hypothetical protein
MMRPANPQQQQQHHQGTLTIIRVQQRVMTVQMLQHMKLPQMAMQLQSQGRRRKQPLPSR